MRKVDAKRGVSLIVLVITIVIIIILSAIVILNTDDSREVAKRTVFISDMTTIEDAVREYYLLNGAIPNYGDRIDKSMFTNIRTLVSEVNANGDENADFYKIDLSKLDLEKYSFGTEYDKSTSTDVCIVAMPSMKVYYVKGVKIEKVLRHSLTVELTGKVSVNKNESDDNSQTTVISNTSSGRLKVIKNAKKPGDISATIIAQMKQGESLIIEVGGETVAVPTTSSPSENVISLEEVLDKNVIDKIKEQKVINILVIDANSEVVEEVEVNFDVSSSHPEFLEGDVITSYDTQNTLNFGVSSENGISYIRYDYDKVYSINNVLDTYYKGMTENEIDTHIYKNGKTCKASSNGRYVVTAPNNVKTIRIVAVDKNGNSTFITKNISNGIYGYGAVSDVKGSTIRLNINMISTIGIGSVKVSYSTDKVNFIGEQTYPLNRQGNVTDIHLINLNDVLLNKLYIKIVATNPDSSITETMVDSLDITNQLYTIDAGIIKKNPNAYYGEYVDYTPSNGCDVKWRIFLADTNIYLIAEDYVPNSYLEWTGLTKSTSTTNNRKDYCVYSEVSREDLVDRLSNPDYYKDFKDTAGKAQSVVGAPTLVQFKDSYNDVNDIKIDILNVTEGQTVPGKESANADGYVLKFSNETNYMYAKTIPSTANKRDLYVKNNVDKANAMWLASLSACSNGHVMIALCSYNVDCYYYNYTTYGSRPLVCLNSNVKLVDSNRDGIYEIQ